MSFRVTDCLGASAEADAAADKHETRSKRVFRAGATTGSPATTAQSHVTHCELVHGATRLV
eukprot:8201729-Lingulodinium_polyedra.AAC.1